MATGENFMRLSAQISNNAKKEKEKILHEAYNMKTNNPYILALRQEIEFYKNDSKSWERMDNESEETIIELLKLSNCTTILELREKLYS